MRSILTTLDDTPSCVAAQRLALDLARRTGAALCGVTAVELSDLDRVEPTPIGGIELAHERAAHRELQAKERRLRIAQLPVEFQQTCSTAGLAAQTVTLEGDLRKDLLHLIETSDLFVTGRDAEFHLEAQEEATPFVEYVLKHGARPVIVSGPQVIEHGTVLVAYDGSAPAAKALQLAVLLGMFGGASAHVLTIGNEHAAAQIAARARDFLARHDIRAEIEPCTSGDDADVLIARARALRPGLLVMGAFGHGGLRDLLFGSCTRQLIDAAPVPLFLYH